MLKIDCLQKNLEVECDLDSSSDHLEMASKRVKIIIFKIDKKGKIRFSLYLSGAQNEVRGNSPNLNIIEIL